MQSRNLELDIAEFFHPMELCGARLGRIKIRDHPDAGIALDLVADEDLRIIEGLGNRAHLDNGIDFVLDVMDILAQPFERRTQAPQRLGPGGILSHLIVKLHDRLPH